MLHRSFLVRVVAVVVLAGLLSELAVGQPPDILRSYRFIPGHSTLGVTGGFAGVDLDYRLFGRFDIVTGYEVSPLLVYPPILIPHAEFENVRAYAVRRFRPGEIAPAVAWPPIPLDHFVDLEQLRGTFDAGSPIFPLYPPDHPLWQPIVAPQSASEYVFNGFDAQGQPFQLKATRHGRLLHMRGANDPSCCDFFEYQLHALAYQTPYGDFNFDGRVDAADYTIWRDTMGSTADLAADGNGDGVVDHADYLVWKGQVGAAAIDMSMFDELDGFDGLAAAAVPEPSTFMLLAIAGGVTIMVLRSLRRNGR